MYRTNSITISWSQRGPKLVADLQRAGIWPIIYLASSELARASRSATCLRPGWRNGILCLTSEKTRDGPTERMVADADRRRYRGGRCLRRSGGGQGREVLLGEQIGRCSKYRYPEQRVQGSARTCRTQQTGRQERKHRRRRVSVHQLLHRLFHPRINNTQKPTSFIVGQSEDVYKVA